MLPGLPVTEQSLHVGEMIRSGTRIPEGLRALLSKMPREPGTEVCSLSPSWSLLPVPARCCRDQWPPSPGSSCVQPQALWWTHFVHGHKELKPPPSSKAGGKGEFPCGLRRPDPGAPTLTLGDCCPSGSCPWSLVPLPILTSLLVSPLLFTLVIKQVPVTLNPRDFPNHSVAHKTLPGLPSLFSLWFLAL